MRRFLQNPWLNFAMSQGAWFACVLGAAYGTPWFGPLAVGIWSLLFVWSNPHPRSEAILLLITGLLGYLCDSLLVVTELFVFAPHVQLGGPSPLWMVALWVLFGTTLRGPLRHLLNRPWLAAIVGAIVGPLAYGAGVRLGAAMFGHNEDLSRLIIAILWAMLLPLFGYIARRTQAS